MLEQPKEPLYKRPGRRIFHNQILKMKFLFLFCVSLALIEALNPLASLKKRLSFKARKGQPFAVHLIAEGESLPKKKSLWSRVRGAFKPKAKTADGKKKRKWGFFRKDMIEPIEGTAMAPSAAFEGSAEMPSDIKPMNQTEGVFDGIQGRVSQKSLYMNGNNYRRCMIKVKIGSKTYEMLFDTASSAGMIPEFNAQVTGSSQFGRVQPLYRPAASSNPAALPIIRHAYSGNGQDYSGFTARVRRAPMTLAGMQFPIDFASAHEISNMRYPIMGASPQLYSLGGTQMVPQILAKTGEQFRRFTTFIGPPSQQAPGAVNGLVVFGGVDSTHCPLIMAWMPINSSGMGQFPSWYLYFAEVYVSGSHTAPISLTAIQHPKHAILDTGSPGIRLQEDLYRSFLEMFVAVTGTVPRRNGDRRYLIVPCNVRTFIVYVRVNDALSGDTLDIPIRAANILHPLDATTCELLVANGEQRENLFGYPFYRSTCVVHDYDSMRVGIAPHAGVY